MNVRLSGHVARAGTIRSVNRAVVDEAIREHGPITRAEMARLTSLSVPTVSAITRQLIKEGLVREQPPGNGGEPGPGRPAGSLVPNARVATVGCDLSVSGEMRVGAVGRLGEVIEARVVPLEPTATPGAAANLVAGYVAELLRGKMIDRIEGIGVGAPGATQKETGVIRWAPALSWSDTAFGTILRERVDLPIVIDNDVNLALLAEARGGSARLYQHVLLISFSDGIGGALWMNGDLYRGRGAAGEVGYMVVAPFDRTVDYRAYGPAESAIHHVLESECRARGIDVTNLEHRSSALVSRLCAGGNTLVLSRDAKEKLLSLVVSLIASGCALLDVEAVVLRGWVKALGPRFMAGVRAQLPRLVGDAAIPVELGAMKEDAVMVGAALAAQSAVRWPMVVARATRGSVGAAARAPGG